MKKSAMELIAELYVLFIANLKNNNEKYIKNNNQSQKIFLKK